MIQNTDMDSDELENIKKWILIGCEIGQRGGDLLRLTKKDIRYKGNRLYIDVVQQKTGKHVTCGIINPTITALIETGFPTSITLNRLNDGIKEVCKKVGIDTMVEGYKLNNDINRMVFGTYPKYDLMASHCFRRSYATNYYKLVHNQILMKSTGHSKEATFLTYINRREDKDSNADLFMDFYEKIHSQRVPQLKVVRSS